MARLIIRGIDPIEMNNKALRNIQGAADKLGGEKWFEYKGTRRQYKEIKGFDYDKPRQENKVTKDYEVWLSHFRNLQSKSPEAKANFDNNRITELVDCFEVEAHQKNEIIQAIRTVAVEWFKDNPKRTKLDGKIVAEILNGYKVRDERKTFLKFLNATVPKVDQEESLRIN